MASMIACTPVLFVLLACVNLVNAEAYYIGPTVGGIVGLVRQKKIELSNSMNCIFRLSLFWISLLL